MPIERVETAKSLEDMCLAQVRSNLMNGSKKWFLFYRDKNRFDPESKLFLTAFEMTRKNLH